MKLLLALLISLFTCWNFNINGQKIIPVSDQPKLILLGTTQDAGSPQAGCQKPCCYEQFEMEVQERHVISLGLYDGISGKYLFEATPDITHQMKHLQFSGSPTEKAIPDAIFLTHAHIGHYTGLMYLGKESMDAREVPVYAMPEMKLFLENNGPWDLLVKRKNIILSKMSDEIPVVLPANIKVTPFLVPHRDEYSETVGYKIEGPNKKALFIPDVDKWHKWDKNIIDEIKKVDYAFLDATFYNGEEIGHRDISEIPHPFVEESISLFEELSSGDRKKIIFIHLNHTNPLLNPESKESKYVEEHGFRIGRLFDEFSM